MLTIIPIEDGAAFHALHSEWNELLESSTSNGIFLTWEWLYTWWRHLRGARRLLILTVRSQGRLLAIAPLAVRPGKLMELTPFPRLEFLGVGTVGSDYLDIIARRGCEAEACEALVNYLHQRKLSLRLVQLSAESSLSLEMARNLGEISWNVAMRETHVCPYIHLSGHTWESYLDTLGPEHRYNLRRRLRRLNADFKVRFERVENEAERVGTMPILVDLHHRRRQTRGGSDALNTPAVLDFHNEWTRLALASEWLRLFILRLDDQPAALLYGLQYAGKFYFYQSGFDPVYSKYSVGLITMGLTIKQAIEEGASEYDLLHGGEAYKFHWAGRARRLLRLDLDPPTGRGLLCRGARGFRSAARRVACQSLPPRVVEWIRNGFSRETPFTMTSNRPGRMASPKA